MRTWTSRAGAALLTAGLALGLSTAVVTVGAAPAGAALVPYAGCPFHFGDFADEGAAGTLYFTLDVLANNSAERCTTAVTFTASVSATGAAYTNVANDPLTATQTVTFTPGRLVPVLAVRWTGLHCADPAGPGTVRIEALGLVRAAFSVSPSTCGGEPGSTLESFPITAPSEVGIAPTPDDHGYRTVDSRGAITSEGDATVIVAAPSNAPVVAIATAPTGSGVWTAAADGGVFAYGSAHFHGSLGAVHLNAPVVGMAATPDGGGYWLVASDGGVFAFGDAGFHGSMGALHLNAPVVGMAATPDGHGYYLVAADGGVFAFGDARFAGSMGSVILNASMVAIAAGPHGGYWLLASDDGVFAFGGAPFEGRITGAGSTVDYEQSAIAATATGLGYWTLRADEFVDHFGDAGAFGTCPC
jgi:uncharacterized membrane protein YgdD (TMEM256/DUF423 family)